MKKTFSILVAVALCSAAAPLRAQSEMPGASPVNAIFSKAFGTNLNFSATMHVDVKMMPQNQTISMTGKAYYSNGDSRSEMDMTQMTGTALPPQAAAQFKAMGMDKMVSIQSQSTKTAYVICPGLKAYAKMKISDAGLDSTNHIKLDTVDLGKETVDGHPCVKKQYTMIDARNGEHLTMTAWLATDLKNVPVQIQQATPGKTEASTNFATIHFADIDLTKPAGSLFVPPTDYTAYSNPQTMIQSEVMKKMSGSLRTPPAGR